MERNILLVEPAYKTKFPPLGLMKISKYHKKLGDKVTFVKGINQKAAYEYWDRIYVSTVFTYNWQVSVDTINFYKEVVRGDSSRIVVGGIMATLMSDELYLATGIVPQRKLLNKPGILDNNRIIIDKLIPDYDLFKDTKYSYDLIKDSYFGYSTRGCVNKCEFCGVPELEGKFSEYRGIKTYVKKITKEYGEKHHLVLFDNNILASKRFDKIVEDIRSLGFGPNAVLNKKKRYVDFNQGTDARLFTEKKAELLSRISINPLRIAFDHVRFKKIYVKAIRLAAKNNIINLSNYVLYNYMDSPEDFWQRLKINIDLNKELGLKIYSFPMKYIPLNAKNRSYISKPNWNRQYIRGVQRILNVLKGSVMTTEDFFFRAFGEDEEQFIKILHMPEKLLMSRGKTPKSEEIDWYNKFDALSNSERKSLLEILCENHKSVDLKYAYYSCPSGKLKNILEYYVSFKEDRNFQLFN